MLNNINHRKMQIKIMRYHLMIIRMEKNKKKIGSVPSEHVEKLEPLCSVDGNVKWYNHCGKQYRGGSSKKLVELPYDQVISLLGIHIHPKELKTGT